jgi:hypothetical protein
MVLRTFAIYFIIRKFDLHGLSGAQSSSKLAILPILSV